VFDTIDGLAAGQSLVLLIKAQAGCPGNLSCRTEVLCRSVDIKLAAEETTRFYGGRVTASPGTGSRQVHVPVRR
jgi:hypothetical protein